MSRTAASVRSTRSGSETSAGPSAAATVDETSSRSSSGSSLSPGTRILRWTSLKSTPWISPGIVRTSFRPSSVQLNLDAPGSSTLVWTLKSLSSRKPSPSRSSLAAAASSPSACHAVTGRPSAEYLSRRPATCDRVRGLRYFANTPAIAVL